MQAAEVRLEQVGKRYGENWVVRNVSLYIRRGEFFTFLGPSGCGKTTLLRMIAGFVTPDEGLVYLDAVPVNRIPPWQRDVGMVFQNYALWPHLTVYENVAFGLRERKVGGRELEARVAQALEQVALTGTEARRPSQLSGGQQQRVALARTLVIRPRVLLLDEPLSNLDAKLRVEMRLELLKLQRDLGLTTIYVTHDQEEALSMSTRIAVINTGRIAQQGVPREIYEAPADAFIAGFVGQGNLLAGKVLRAADGLMEVETHGAQLLQVALPRSSPVPASGDSVVLGVRPETISLKEYGTAGREANQLAGTIAATAYQGGFVEYEVLAAGKALKVRVINPKGKQLFERGDKVIAGFAPEDVMLVPGALGELPSGAIGEGERDKPLPPGPVRSLDVRQR